MWLKKNRPLVILAPMDGYTQPPFRRFIKSVAPETIVFSEFLSAALVHKKPSLAPELFKIWKDEEPVVIQLYGKDVDDFRVAACLAEEHGAAGVDINMGCPAKKVVAHRHGSALMKEIDLACNIIEELKRHLRVPVTVKTRLGWENSQNLIPFAKQLQDVGLDGITIHGRTYSQKFEGEADWEPIYALKDALNIPVFGNGDIVTAEGASEKLGNLDGVMIGRGAIDDPWLLQRVYSLLHHETPNTQQLPFHVKVPYWKQFATMSVEQSSEYHACCAFRKYLVRLVRDLGLGPEIRRKAICVETLEQVHHVLDLFSQMSTEAKV